jgi:transposase-like protein
LEQEMVTRKQYTKEYKVDAISLVLEQGHTTSEVSRSLEINTNMLRRWIREYQADDADQSLRGEWETDSGAGRDPAVEGADQATQAGEGNTKGSDGLFRERNEVKYSFITQRKKTYPVGLMCQLMGVSRSAYYDDVRCTDNCSADPCHEEILETVRGIANSSNHSYGNRRIGKALNALGVIRLVAGKLEV